MFSVLPIKGNAAPKAVPNKTALSILSWSFTEASDCIIASLAPIATPTDVPVLTILPNNCAPLLCKLAADSAVLPALNTAPPTNQEGISANDTTISVAIPAIPAFSIVSTALCHLF